MQAAVKKEYFPDQFTVIPKDGDKVTVGDKQLTWHAVDTKLYNVNLYHFARNYGKPTSDVLFWAVTVVNAPQEMRNVRLAIGSNAASVWWINGQEVIGIYGDRQTVIDDGVSKRLTLKKGPNIIRAAIVNGGGATDFCARFLDENESRSGTTPSRCRRTDPPNNRARGTRTNRNPPDGQCRRDPGSRHRRTRR